MPNQTSERQQDLAKIQQQFKAGGDKIIEKICERIRETEPGMPLILTFCKEVPSEFAQLFTARAIEKTAAEGHTVYGLVINFEPD